MPDPSISVVTPTLRRPEQVRALLTNLSRQKHLPHELILVDGAPAGEDDTQRVIERSAPSLPFAVNYIRRGGGTAIQRNIGIDAAQGEYIAFIDDDIRLEPDFFTLMLEAFAEDVDNKVGGVTGYITNQHLDPTTSKRWKWYRRLKLFTTFEPGRFDYQTGYPINRYLQPPHDTLREVDFLSSGAALWRRQVFEGGLRFDEFFVGFGVLEDAQMSLRAKRDWVLLEHGLAHCQHLHAREGREDGHLVARKTAINHRYLFITIVPNRTIRQELRFWLVQCIQLIIYLNAALNQPKKKSWEAVTGKILGIYDAFLLTHIK
ncbi:MAG: glycosyltransferase family 2 protein [Desulfobacterales bacterium]|nr:glycosyltransferase family 2 protein [Desulfobacterales bacterium]